MKRHGISRRDKPDSEMSDPVRSRAPERARPTPIHQLQEALGNRAIGRFIQTKLQVNQPGDANEQEADRVADQVMRMQDPATDDKGGSGETQVSLTPTVSRLADSDSESRLSRMCTDCEEVEKGVQLKEIPGAAPEAHPLVGPAAGSGQPLDSSVRSFFEPRFGHAFDEVRIHTDQQAAESARALNAHAYTLGKDIVFNEGTYSPETNEGRRLLAHELTHTIQQGNSSGLQTNLIQRDLAIEPTVANPADVVLTPANMQRAIGLNLVMFTDEAEIALVRDVLGVPREPSVVDEDFVNAVIRYQSSFGLTPDGMLGPRTADRLSQEITAEADRLADPPTGTPRRRVARRLHLRSMTSRTAGTMTHQGFVGPDDNPEGAVTIRTGDRQGAPFPNVISAEYTGENADAVNWLQFVDLQMFATPPGGTRVFNAGVLLTQGGNITWSDNTTQHWSVDAIPPPAPGPFYDVSGGLNTRAAGRRIALLDQPGGPLWLPFAQAFASPGALAAGATTVTLRARFVSYVVRNNRARYQTSWTATSNFDITAATTGPIVYAQGSAGTVTGLQPVHRTALLAEYAGSPVQ